MNKSKRPLRSTKKIFKVFCEGDTEYHYFDAFRRDKRLCLKLDPIDMNGGGYASFLSEVRKSGNTNCLAKFIIIDGDKAIVNDTELENLKKLVNYCSIQNDNNKIPHILILNCPDFEYVACLHSSKYSGQDTKRFIETVYKYKSVNDFKADDKVYSFLNSNDRSYRVMLNAISKTDVVVFNDYEIKKSSYTIKIKDINTDYTNLVKRGSNIFDFFDIIKTFEPSI